MLRDISFLSLSLTTPPAPIGHFCYFLPNPSVILFVKNEPNVQFSFPMKSIIDTPFCILLFQLTLHLINHFTISETSSLLAAWCALWGASSFGQSATWGYCSLSRIFLLEICHHK